MARKDKFDYFEAMEKIVGLACEEAKALEKALQNFDPEKLFDQMNAMHLIENEADKVNHEIYDHLAAEFITPIERDDILNLSQMLDEIVDNIEDVMMRMYMYNVLEMYGPALDMVSLIEKSTNALRVAMIEFGNFKKSETIKQLLIDVSDYEEAADKKYVMGIRHLHTQHADDAVFLFTWENMLVRMEKCCDACAHAADTMSTIIMKNT